MRRYHAASARAEPGSLPVISCLRIPQLPTVALYHNTTNARTEVDLDSCVAVAGVKTVVNASVGVISNVIADESDIPGGMGTTVPEIENGIQLCFARYMG